MFVNNDSLNCLNDKFDEFLKMTFMNLGRKNESRCFPDAVRTVGRL